MSRTYKGPFFTSPYKNKLNDVFTTVSTTSGTWVATSTIVQDSSANWNGAVTLLESSSAGWNDIKTVVEANSASWDEVSLINVTNGVGLNTIDAVLSASYEGIVWDVTLKKGTDVRMSNVMMVWNSGGEFEYTETSTADIGSTSAITLSTTMISNSAILQSSITLGDWVIKGRRNPIS